MDSLIKKMEDDRLKRGKSKSAYARMIGIPHWVYRNIVEGRTEKTRDYHYARIVEWIKKCQ